MAKRVLSVPQVLINDEVITIVPNSFTYDAGEPEINVRASSIGNGEVESVHTENAESAISKVSFDVFLDTALDSKVATWKLSVGTNTVKALEQVTGGDSFVRTFPGMSLMSRVERDASADGVTTLEWSGDQMVRG